jgi:hypothetical protein
MKDPGSSETLLKFYQIALYIPGDNFNNILTVEGQFLINLHCFWWYVTWKIEVFAAVYPKIPFLQVNLYPIEERHLPE